MDYTEQFIRLNCSLMSDYKMMKLNADMKCMGLGLYLKTILFLRKQEEYKHDFNELDLLAEQWGVTVENLQHLIKDFNLFVITEDGYFRSLYLDEVMGYQNKLLEKRAAAGSKGGKSSKKKTVKATVPTASEIGRDGINEGKGSDAPCMDSKEEIYMANSAENNVKNSAESMKNATEKNTDEFLTEKLFQFVDNECCNKPSQASFKQNFIREEENREEKKNNSNKEKEIIAVTAVDEPPRFSESSETIPRWEQCINEAFTIRSWLEAVGMMSGLKELFLNNLSFIRDLFKKHVVAQGNTGGITSVSEAQAYFANYIRRERPTRLFLEEKLKERSRMQKESVSFSPYESYNPQTGERSYCGVPLPADAPPRPNGRVTWDNLKQRWI
ncbi:DUF4373 domain-containing protein [uncultured Phocaeicola sp.]|uniref:DUF4373 domain-containing protein n=1 Tax=uncultured Phocaeicola sp. TaxID=990718 RepID=UPI0014338E90|nr:DUF4373 domain-containing protein [uncultured Phocaeicola sp.]GFH97782.1 hypothetical protein IMSAGC004_00165 [Bacteroidaceae bacterium]